MTTKNNHASDARSLRRHILMTSVLFVALTAIGIIPLLLIEQDRRATKRRDLNDFGTVVAQSLERQLERSISKSCEPFPLSAHEGVPSWYSGKPLWCHQEG